MKRYLMLITIVAAMLAAMMACTKDASLQNPEGDTQHAPDMRHITVRAYLTPTPDAAASTSAAPESTASNPGGDLAAAATDPEPLTMQTQYSLGEGVKVAWAVDDAILLCDAQGGISELYVSEVLPDGSAVFEGETSATPGSEVTAFLENAAVSVDCYDRSTHTMRIDLSTQRGTFSDAANHDVVFAKGTCGETSVNLHFEHKTTMLCFYLTLPQGEGAGTELKNFIISSGNSEERTYKNVMNVNTVTGATTCTNGGSAAATGEIMSPSTSTIISGGTILPMYYSVCPVALQNAIIQCTVARDPTMRYVWRVAGASTPLVPEAGKFYLLQRRQPRQAMSGTFWVDDSALTVGLGAAAIDIPENTTGNPVTTESSTDLWGYKYNLKVLQIEPKDFAGDYTLAVESTGAVFTATSKGTVSAATTASAGTYGSKGGVTKGYWYDSNWTRDKSFGASTAVNFAYTGGSPYNLSASLYEDLRMPASATIDYDNHVATLTLRIENKSYQVSTGLYGGTSEYLAYQTELISNPGSSEKYQLGYANGGAFSYGGSVAVKGSDITATFAKDKVCTAYTKFNVRGILVNRYVNNSGVTATQLIRSTNNFYAYDQPNASGSAYALAIQGTFTLTKASGTVPAGGITGIGYTPKN